jgi:hypothetical protein
MSPIEAELLPRFYAFVAAAHGRDPTYLLAPPAFCKEFRDAMHAGRRLPDGLIYQFYNARLVETPAVTEPTFVWGHP